VLRFRDDLLDIEADCVERPNAGEGQRGAFIEMREWGVRCGDSLQARPSEERRPLGGYFNPGRQAGKA